jgi:hypothetical protein
MMHDARTMVSESPTLQKKVKKKSLQNKGAIDEKSEKILKVASCKSKCLSKK